ncbi:hypothetical protein PLICRDRAFT_176742 [Plicaturopsis crispa FD-325 SS-3]|nr:hypothetical protein PLICRDRAFT_176742 [Plicaturopsis crispa FD-325 SS-3]
MADSLKPFEPAFPFDNFIGVRERAVCFHCGNATMFCTCDVDPGTDFTMSSWDIPDLTASQKENPRACLGRFIAMSKMHPHNIRIESVVDWDAFFNENLGKMLEVWPRIAPTIVAIAESTNKSIYTKPEDKDTLMTLRRKHGMKKAGPNELRAAARGAVQKLMRFEWTLLTRFDTVLLRNAFLRRDFNTFPPENTDVKFVSDTNDTLHKYIDSWTSTRLGHHISLEEEDEF